MIDRRQFIAVGCASAATFLFGGTRLCAQAGTIVRPEDHGARGDGRSDDTAALQRAMNSVPAGGSLQLRRGAVYRVHTNANPSWGSFGGLRMKGGTTLEMNGAELRALPSSEGGGAVVQAYLADRWRIAGPGRIVGERAVHRGRAGEWGMGIAVFGSSQWAIDTDLEITGCWGDGVYAGRVPDRPGSYSTGFTIAGLEIHDCRRNGISIVGARDGIIRDVHIYDINGTAPMAGIDLEPDTPAHGNRNILIEGVRTERVQIGVGVSVSNERVRIVRSRIEAANSGIIISDHTRNLEIVDNLRIANTHGGAEGGAIRSMASDGATINDVRIRNNTLAGGGFFVLDFTHSGYRGLSIADNIIQASNSGTIGIARMLGGGTFTGNHSIIERSAGQVDDYYLQLHGVSYGGNRYESRSAARMRALKNGGRDLGGEVLVTPRSLVS